jgi:hypothetical protein
MRARKQTLASKSLNRAMKWLYNLSSIVLIVLSTAFAHAQTEIVIEAENAIFLPAPAFITGAPVSMAAPVGPFLRDCDGDGILEADTNGDGACTGDPKVMDYRAVGTRELPPGTPFTGSFAFTCFHIPDDVAIITTGPLTIMASEEVAIFGALRLSGGADISTPVDIDARASVWLSDSGNINLTSSLIGDAYAAQVYLGDSPSVPKVSYPSACEVTETAVRSVIPPEVAQGSVVTIKGYNFGMAKGKVSLGTVKATVKTWTRNRITAELKKVPTISGTYDSFVTPKKAATIRTEGAYQVKGPEWLEVSPEGGIMGDTITIKGKFFGKKKGKLTIGGKKCKITVWTMNGRSGLSETKCIVPKGLVPGSNSIILANQVGSFSVPFEIYDLTKFE